MTACVCGYKKKSIGEVYGIIAMIYFDFKKWQSRSINETSALDCRDCNILMV